MGPQPLSRGNGTGEPACSPRTRALQWGRNLSVAETRPRQPLVESAPLPASMGPQPLSRGNDSDYLLVRRIHRASMGPQPLSRGNLGERARADGLAPRFNGAATSQSRKLGSLVRRQRRRLRRFNGAATSQSRKRRGRGKSGHRRVQASMGPQPLSRGNCAQSHQGRAQ